MSEAVKGVCAFVITICTLVLVCLGYYEVYQLFRVGALVQGVAAGALLTAFVALLIGVTAELMQ